MENIKNNLATIVEDIVYTNPSLLLDFENYDKIALLYLPYSIGIELECFQGENYNVNEFKNILNILAVNVDSSEQRYRIPNGINGLICLFNLSQKLKEFSLLNESSGLHYHCDFTDCPESITQENIDFHKEWILSELDNWEYKGTYNQRDIAINSRKWIRFNYYPSTSITGKITMEVRIGEMTFDYPLLLKRIVHICSIARRFKANNKVDLSTIKLTNLLKKLKSEIPEEIQSKNEIEINNIVKKRVVKYHG